MRTVIDTTVPNAEIYYRTYLREPSPAGDITIGASEITAVGDINFEFVLNQIKAVGVQGEMLLVTHSNPKGLIMHLTQGAGVSAGLDELKIIMTIQNGVRRKQQIDQLPSNKQFEAWRKWFQDFDPGVVLAPNDESNPEWPQFVSQKFDEWFQRQGQTVLKLPNPKTDLQRLLNLVADVQKLNFKRFEFRACRLGTDPDALKVIAAFINGANQANISVIAPKEVRTTYARAGAANIVPNLADFRRQVAAPGAPRSTARTGGRVMALRVLSDKIAFFQVDQRGFFAIAVDDATVKTFITSNISSAYSGNGRPLVIGCLEPSSAATAVPGKKEVFPLEPEYKGLLNFLQATPPAPPKP